MSKNTKNTPVTVDASATIDKFASLVDQTWEVHFTNWIEQTADFFITFAMLDQETSGFQVVPSDKSDFYRRLYNSTCQDGESANPAISGSVIFSKFRTRLEKEHAKLPSLATGFIVDFLTGPWGATRKKRDKAVPQALQNLRSRYLIGKKALDNA